MNNNNENQYYSGIDNYDLIDVLLSKNSFYLDIFKGVVLPVNHPDYYKNHTDLKILKISDDVINASANINGINHELDSNKISTIEKLLTGKLQNLLTICENQSNINYFGGSNNLIVKIKGIIINIDILNINDNDKLIIDDIVNEIISILYGN
ncbi:MAG: hypothetical protein ACI4U0_02115 [Candidatus Aphodocola sp.]